MNILLLVAAGMAVAEDTSSTLRSRNDSVRTGEAMSDRVLETVGEPVMMDFRPIDCQDLFDFGYCSTGLRYIYPDPKRPYHRVKVYCEQTLDGGGWTVIQRRTDSRPVREDFQRSWVEYKTGFGNLEGEFWLGNDNIHAMTFKSMQELRVDMYDWEGNYRWAKYGYFYVGNESTKYQLQNGRYTGTAGDLLGIPRLVKSKFLFSTLDKHYHNCASQKPRGWWYGPCAWANLNGDHRWKGAYFGNENQWEGITWFKGSWYSLRHTTMMIRPAF